MAITYPNKMPILNDEEYSVERPISTQAARKLAQAVNMLSRLVPVAAIRAYAVNQNGVKSPDINGQYQYCDGVEITNPNSPLKTTGITHRFTPDMRDQFVRGANGGTNAGNEVGGVSSVNLAHVHTAGNVQPPRGSDGEEGDEQASGVDHSHGISSDLSASEPVEPAHVKVAWYLKIN